MLNNNEISEKEKELRQAAANADVKQVRKLLETPNIDVNSTSTNGNTALDWTVLRANNDSYKNKVGYITIALNLIFHGAKISNKIRDLISKNTPEMIILNRFISELNNINNLHPGFLAFFLENFSCEHSPDTATEAKHFHIQFMFLHLLLSLFLLIELNKHVSQNKINILSIGCGTSSELLPLIYFFNKYNIQIHYIGVDIDAECIDLNKSFYNTLEDINFITVDATKPEELIKNGVKPDSFDLVIIRNPNLTGLYHVFKDILATTAPIFAKSNGGRIYLSFYKADYDYYKENFPNDIFTEIRDTHHHLTRPRNLNGIEPDLHTLLNNINPKYLKKIAVEKENYSILYEKSLQERQSVESNRPTIAFGL